MHRRNIRKLEINSLMNSKRKSNTYTLENNNKIKTTFGKNHYKDESFLNIKQELKIYSLKLNNKENN